MKVLSFRSLGALALCFLLVGMLSCAHDQQLVSISIEPSTETFGASDIPVPSDAGLSVQLRALGHYIHPPVTKDITSQVTWVSNTPGIATVDASGLLVVTGLDCGGSLVSATVQTNHSAGDRPSSGAIVTGTMAANVVCFTGTGGGTSPVLTVNVAGTGTVSSAPAGINCPTQCTATFTSGTPITLIATPTAPATTVTWAGCTPQTNPLACDLTITATTTVNATFQ
jgi:Bacterial Ig-like domain (group 2)